MRLTAGSELVAVKSRAVEPANKVKILCVYLMLRRPGYSSVYNLRKPSFFGEDFCHGGIKSKQRVTVLLACNADGSDKLPPLLNSTLL
jgi:hypothetical protein